VLFINLSKTFLASTEIQRAFTQVETTALAVGGVKTIVLLVEGEPFSLEP
jgi:spore germination protein GerM